MFGRLAQLVRASPLQGEGRGFESLSAHHRLQIFIRPSKISTEYGFWINLFTRSNYFLLVVNKAPTSAIYGGDSAIGDVRVASLIRDTITNKN